MMTRMWRRKEQPRIKTRSRRTKQRMAARKVAISEAAWRQNLKI